MLQIGWFLGLKLKEKGKDHVGYDVFLGEHVFISRFSKQINSYQLVHHGSL